MTDATPQYQRERCGFVRTLPLDKSKKADEARTMRLEIQDYLCTLFRQPKHPLKFADSANAEIWCDTEKGIVVYRIPKAEQLFDFVELQETGWSHRNLREAILTLILPPTELVPIERTMESGIGTSSGGSIATIEPDEEIAHAMNRDIIFQIQYVIDENAP